MQRWNISKAILRKKSSYFSGGGWAEAWKCYVPSWWFLRRQFFVQNHVEDCLGCWNIEMQSLFLNLFFTVCGLPEKLKIAHHLRPNIFPVVFLFISWLLFSSRAATSGE